MAQDTLSIDIEVCMVLASQVTQQGQKHKTKSTIFAKAGFTIWWPYRGFLVGIGMT